MDLVYRKLRAHESGKYRMMRLESLQRFPDSFGARLDVESAKEKLAYEGYVEKKNADCFIVGAFKEEELIGICGFYKQRDERCKHRGDIIQMYVKPEYSGRQIGYHLLRETVAIGFQIDGLEQIELSVMSDAIAANKTYEKVGFLEAGVQKGFYKLDKGYTDKRLMVLERGEFSY